MRGRLGFAVLTTLLLLPLAWTQETTGRIEGTVVDESGAPLPGATVELWSEAGTRTTTSHRLGVFRFLGLAPGRYGLRVSLSGFATVQVGVDVGAGRTASPRFVLRVATVEETISVVGEAPPRHPGEGRKDRRKGERQAPPAPVAPPAPPPPPVVAAVPPSVRVPPPGVGFNTESYGRYDDNPFLLVEREPYSTFSVDVDTASYANVRRFLGQGLLPPRDAVRIEELINYFSYDYPPPQGSEPFSVTVEVGDSPWAPRHRLVHVGLQGRRLEEKAVPPRNLVFLVDVSGSMAPANKLPLLKSALRLLVDRLRPEDRVALVVYAGDSGVVLGATAGDRKGAILSAIDGLQAGGSTNGGAGLVLAYRTAVEGFVTGGVNRVILATDGDFNVGVTGSDLTRLIEEKRRTGVFLSVLGFGEANLKDAAMEQLADRGNGNYSYVDSLQEAGKVLATEAAGMLVTIAKDVKVQVEFNPMKVQAYRLIGYENRILRDEDFRDDRKDAGEVGAGHSVTALYEIVPAGRKAAAGDVAPLRYQGERKRASAAGSGELMTVKLRWKKPDEDQSVESERRVPDPGSLPVLRPNLGFAAAVAAFGMLLRESEHRGATSWEQVVELGRRYRGSDPEGRRAEFVRLAGLAASLTRTDRAAVP